MEDILSSIKRIIAEEGDGTAVARARRAPRAAPATISPAPAPLRRAAIDPRDVLELSNPVTDDVDGDEDGPEPVRPEPVRPEPVRPEPVRIAVPSDAILSETAAQASRGALDTLSRMIVKPAPAPDAAAPETLESMVREMLRPMLREWLDAKLPGMVEEMVAREIARITQGR